MQVPTRMLQWPENNIRRASVNSFGVGGTIAHVIVEAADDYFKSIKHTRSQGRKNSYHESKKNTLSKSHKGTPTTINFHGVTSGPKNVPNGTKDERTPQIEDHSGQQYKSSESSPSADISKPRLFGLSHDDEGELSRLAANLRQFIYEKNLDESDTFLDSLAFTLSERRSFLEFRSFVTASTIDELVDGLEK